MTIYIVLILLMTFFFGLAFLPAVGGISSIVLFVLMMLFPDFFLEFTGASATELAAWYLFVLIISILQQAMLIATRVWLYASPVTWLRFFNVVTFIVLLIIVTIMNFGALFGTVIVLTLVPSLGIITGLEKNHKCVCINIGDRKLCYNKDMCDD